MCSYGSYDIHFSKGFHGRQVMEGNSANCKAQSSVALPSFSAMRGVVPDIKQRVSGETLCGAFNLIITH